MLVHICCSVDSSYFLKKLQEKLGSEKIIGYFYDPNIHPYSEYYLRMLDAKRSCEKLAIEFIEGEYDYENWILSVKGLEAEPEDSIRCKVCFDSRLEASAKKAKALGETKMTTTLLMSPKKDFKKLEKSAEHVQSQFGVEFAFFDFRKNGGTQAQFLLAKEEHAYRQNYCGCLYGLSAQREKQNRSANELYSDSNALCYPNSIQERMEVFATRDRLEQEQKKYKISKRNILNYRLLWGRVSQEKKVLDALFLPYSYSKQKKFSVSEGDNEKAFLFSAKEIGIEFLDLKHYSFEKLVALREKLGFKSFDVSVVIILERVNSKKYKIELTSEIFTDTQQIIEERDGE